MTSNNLPPGGGERIYRILAHLAGCDGQVAVSERDLLERYRSRFGLSVEQARDLESECADDETLVLGTDPAERKLTVKAMAEVVAADRRLEQDESEQLRELLGRMGMQPQEVMTALMDRLMGPPV